MMQRTALAPLAILLGLVLPAAVFAQGPEGTLVLPTDVSIHDVGWSQWRNLEELGAFFLAVAETLGFVAAFAFHPKADALRDTASGWKVQASMFLFGLIGMLVGFLVVHHGFLIGFVIFGIGGLFRFRMESSSLLDGALLILVTLIGLTVGLNLPVMALVATVAGWMTLWFVAARTTSVLELKFKDDDTLRAARGLVRTALERRGFRVVSVRKSDFKPVLELVLSHKDNQKTDEIAHVLEDLNQAGHGPKDWYVV